MKTELTIVFLLYLINLGIITLSYKAGAEAWKEKFSHDRIAHDGSVQQISGLMNELIFSTFWIVGYVLVVLICPDTLVKDMENWQYLVLLAVFVIMVPVILQNQRISINADCERSEEFIQQTRAAYRIYWFFPIVFYFGIAVGISKIGIQFFNEKAMFEIASKAMLLDLSNLLSNLSGTITLEPMLEIERLYIRYNALNRDIIRQMDPLVMFAVYLMLVIILVANTSIRQSFTTGSRNNGSAITYSTALLIFVIAIAVYFVQYSGVSKQYFELMGQLSQQDFSNYEYLARVSVILDEVQEFSGFSGFFRTFSREGGMYLIALAATQLASTVILKRDADAPDSGPKS